jgi:small subunit ribosomal protein S20
MTVSAVRTARKKFLAAVEAKDKESAGKLLQVAQKLIDSGASKGILKRNTAARLKSRLHQRYNALGVE